MLKAPFAGTSAVKLNSQWLYVRQSTRFNEHRKFRFSRPAAPNLWCEELFITNSPTFFSLLGSFDANSINIRINVHLREKLSKRPIYNPTGRRAQPGNGDVFERRFCLRTEPAISGICFSYLNSFSLELKIEIYFRIRSTRRKIFFLAEVCL